ncbi:MAG: cell division protein FtsQ [Cyclobacteriaceae bacterium]
MKFKFNIRRELTIVAVLVVLFGLIAFTERMKGEVTVSAIQISMENIHENHYLDEKDIVKLMRLNAENLKGVSLNQLNFSAIEYRIRQSPFVSNAELYSDLKGNLMVKVALRRPIARIIQSDGPDAYIGEDGTIIPISDKFSSRVVLVSGDFVPKLLKLDNIHQLDEGRQLMLLLNTIREDPFWNAQVAQIDMDSKAKTILFPQVGDETIEFGKAEDLETKFRKLKIFYKEILPRVGWNKYDRINVEYEGQVVAE